MFRKCDVHAGTKHRCRREGHLVGHAVMQGFSVPIYMCNQHGAEYEKYGKTRILNKFTSLFDERDWLEPWAQDGRPIESIDALSSEEPKSPLSPGVEGDMIVFGSKDEYPMERTERTLAEEADQDQQDWEEACAADLAASLAELEKDVADADLASAADLPAVNLDEESEDKE